MEWNLKEKITNKFICGLTGGIASGKSTVGALLSDCGCVLLDCDKIYHQLLTTNGELQEALVNNFRTAERRSLSALVFSQPELLTALNNLTHPFIASELARQIKAQSADSIIVIEATLLFESGLGLELPHNISVEVSSDTRLSRLMARNNLSREAALMRINAQNTDDFRHRQADLYLKNDGSKDDLEKAVKELWMKLRLMAADRL